MKYKDIMKMKPKIVEYSSILASPNFQKTGESPQHGNCGFERGIEFAITGTNDETLEFLEPLEKSAKKMFLAAFALGYLDANELRLWTEDRTMPIPPQCCQSCDSMRECYAIIYSGQKLMNTKFIKRKPSD